MTTDSIYRASSAVNDALRQLGRVDTYETPDHVPDLQHIGIWLHHCGSACIPIVIRLKPDGTATAYLASADGTLSPPVPYRDLAASAGDRKQKDHVARFLTNAQGVGGDASLDTSAITEQYAPDEVADFLRDEGIPPPELPLPRGTTEGDAYVILTTLWRWGSRGRKLLRRFIGRWLDDQLMTGPDAGLRAELIELVARQGWCVRETDSVLVIAEPVRGIPVSAPFLRASRLHPLIYAEARPQFLIDKPDQGVFASMKAVEVRVRKLGGFGDDIYGVDLMNRAFGPTGPLTDTLVGKGEQEGTRAFFAGAYAVLRNPAGHLQIHYDDWPGTGNRSSSRVGSWRP